MLQKLIKNWTRLILIIAMSIILMPNLSYSACPKDSNTYKDPTQFEVKTFLSVNEDCENSENASGNQDQAYFNDKENAPLISFILLTIEFLTKVAGSIALIIIIIAGVMMISGVEEQMNKAKDMIASAAVGLALTFSAYIIVTFVQSMFV